MKKILLVDMNSFGLIKWNKTLKKAGYKVYHSPVGYFEAIEAVLTVKPDIIICTLSQYKGMDIEFVRILKQPIASECYAPILYVTSDENTRSEATKAGATDFLLENFSEDELLLKCKALSSLFEKKPN